MDESNHFPSSSRGGGGRNTPVFVNTRDLVHFSLGIQGQEVQGEVMDVGYEDEDNMSTAQEPPQTSDFGANFTHGLSNYYNVSEEDEQVRNITNEYLEGKFVVRFLPRPI